MNAILLQKIKLRLQSLFIQFERSHFLHKSFYLGVSLDRFVGHRVFYIIYRPNLIQFLLKFNGFKTYLKNLLFETRDFIFLFCLRLYHSKRTLRNWFALFIDNSIAQTLISKFQVSNFCLKLFNSVVRIQGLNFLNLSRKVMYSFVQKLYNLLYEWRLKLNSCSLVNFSRSSEWENEKQRNDNKLFHIVLPKESTRFASRYSLLAAKLIMT